MGRSSLFLRLVATAAVASAFPQAAEAFWFGDATMTPPPTTAVPPGTKCSTLTSCGECVSDFQCGWCSKPVELNGSTSSNIHCAGATAAFTCTGVFSVDQCERGYKCDESSFTCKLTPAGGGEQYDQCKANCTNLGQVYKCDEESSTCKQVKQGTPGSTSFKVCNASCNPHHTTHPAHSHKPESHKPMSPKPSSASPSVYACNKTIGQCQVTKPGAGTAKSVCDQTCKKVLPGDDYFCNSVLHKCEKAPKGFPSTSYAVCEKACKPPSIPGPPAAFLGLWRGVLIQNGYTIGEWDVEFTKTQATFVDNIKGTTVAGTPSTVTVAQKEELWVNLTSGPNAGEVLKGISEQVGRGPETIFLTAAFNLTTIPNTINDAMTTPGSQVFFLAKCAGTPECMFKMPTPSPPMSRLRLFDELQRAEMFGALPVAQNLEDIEDEELRAVAQQTADPCSQYATDCSVCLAHPPCGWCSTKVLYPGGVTGTQCAGFSQGVQYTCHGRFSRDNCTQGYTCNKTTHQCVEDATPGNGFKETECDQLCKPTPKPTPKPPQYVCNVQTKKCEECGSSDPTSCPGAMPEATCDTACANPKKGPTALVKGLWRGVQIQQRYDPGEQMYDFGNETLTVFQDGNQTWTANVTSFGSDEMLLNVLTGMYAGTTIVAGYTVAGTGAGTGSGSGLYEVMTLAMSIPNGVLPTSFSSAMKTIGEIEVVLAKCTSAPCKFVLPK